MSLAYQIATKTREHGPQSLGRREAVGSRGTIPAAVKGWNARDALAAMKPQYAITMDNFFAEQGRVRLRRGAQGHATGLTSSVETLFAHVSGSTNIMVGCGGGGIWNVSAAGAAIELVAAGTDTSSRWHHASMSGSTVMVNGSDDPRRLMPDGTFAIVHGWTGTGLTASNLHRVVPHKGRLMFAEKDTATIWYGGIGAIQGSMEKFPIDRFYPEGGNIEAMGALTIDSGIGVDDLFCVFLSSGAVLVYQGTDISDANSWGIVGTFNLGRVVGDRPLIKFAGDLIAITVDGYIPLTQFLARGRDSDSLASSDAISSAVSEAVRFYGSNLGWQAILHAPANWLLFNVPAGAGTVQHVQNTQTGAWARFRGWQATSWARYKDELYFGSVGGEVFKADVGGTDGTDAIEGDVQLAYSYLRTPEDKRFTLLRALIETDGGVNFRLGTSVDFEQAAVLDTSTSIAGTGTAWNTAAWNTFRWAGGVVQRNEWQSVDKEGTALSVRLRTNTKNARVSMYAIDVVYERTSGIL